MLCNTALASVLNIYCYLTQTNTVIDTLGWVTVCGRVNHLGTLRGTVK